MPQENVDTKPNIQLAARSVVAPSVINPRPSSRGIRCPRCDMRKLDHITPSIEPLNCAVKR
jgi:hypothetical protein